MKENSIIFCTVKSIETGSVFVETQDGFPGSIVLPEIAAGRIRNLREYVHPGKKIVCKVLKVYSDHLELSLRRVTGKEREHVLEDYKKENILKNMLKSIVNNPEEIISSIKKDMPVTDFFQKQREKESITEKYLPKDNAMQLNGLMVEKREKDKKVKKIILLKSDSEDGILEIKDALSIKNVDINYLGSSKFSVSATSPNFKDAEHKVQEAIKEIESKAKAKKMHIELK